MRDSLSSGSRYSSPIQRGAAHSDIRVCSGSAGMGNHEEAVGPEPEGARICRGRVFGFTILDEGVSPKLQIPWEGLYTVVERVSNVTYRIHLGSRSKPKVVNSDRLWRYYSPEKYSWGTSGADLMTPVPAEIDEEAVGSARKRTGSQASRIVLTRSPKLRREVCLQGRRGHSGVGCCYAGSMTSRWRQGTNTTWQ